MSKTSRRKNIRLKDYDYSQNGYYFVTICTIDKKHILWANHVGAPTGRPALSDIGIIIEKAIENIPNIYENVSIDKYIIMPNHIHMIMVLQDNEDGRPMGAPTISQIINQLKGYVTKQTGYPIWQKLFYDHVIRNDKEYQEIYEYIDTNPLRWELDTYYSQGDS